MVRVSFRAGRNTSVSTGWVGGLALLIVLAVVAFYAILFVAAVVVLTGVGMAVRAVYERRKQR